MTLFALFFLLPLLWMVSIAFKTQREMFNMSIVPAAPTFDNFISVFFRAVISGGGAAHRGAPLRRRDLREIADQQRHRLVQDRGAEVRRHVGVIERRRDLRGAKPEIARAEEERDLRLLLATNVISFIDHELSQTMTEQIKSQVKRPYSEIARTLSKELKSENSGVRLIYPPEEKETLMTAKKEINEFQRRQLGIIYSAALGLISMASDLMVPGSSRPVRSALARSRVAGSCR